MQRSDTALVADGPVEVWTIRGAVQNFDDGLDCLFDLPWVGIAPGNDFFRQAVSRKENSGPAVVFGLSKRWADQRRLAPDKSRVRRITADGAGRALQALGRGLGVPFLQ